MDSAHNSAADPHLGSVQSSGVGFHMDSVRSSGAALGMDSEDIPAQHDLNLGSYIPVADHMAPARLVRIRLVHIRSARRRSLLLPHTESYC